MKKSYKIFALALLSFLIVNCTLKIENCSAQWVQMSNGMGNISVYSIYSNGNNIYTCAGINGAYRSTNYGENWTAINNGLSGIYVWTIKAIGSNLFAGTYSGVYLSTNNGENWIPVNNGLPSPNLLVYCLLVNGNNLFAGLQSGGGIYISTNNGGNWSACGLSGQSIRTFAGYGSNIFAVTSGTNPTGIYLSTNNGGNWTAVNSGLIELSVNAIISNGTNTFAGTGLNTSPGGVYLSTNNGGIWTSVNNGITNLGNYSFAMDANNVFVGGDSGIFLSTNNGGNWIKKNQGFVTNPYARSLLIVNGYIFAGTAGQSVWRRNLSEILTGNLNISESVPESYLLYQNYPNPFNPSTNIRYEIPKNGFVKLVVFDILGREIQTLVNEKQNAGSYEIKFDGSKLSSGIYFYTLSVGEYKETKKLVLLK